MNLAATKRKSKTDVTNFDFFSFQTNNRCLNVVHIKTVYNKYYYYTLKMNFYWIYGPNRTVRSKFDYAHLLKRPRKSRESGFPRLSSQEIGSSLVSLEMIFEALQSELFRFKFHTLSSKILKIPEFNLYMFQHHFEIHWNGFSKSSTISNFEKLKTIFLKPQFLSDMSFEWFQTCGQW